MSLEKVILVGIKLKSDKSNNDTLIELEHLADTANLEVVNIFTQNLDAPINSTYVGSGKLKEIAKFAKDNEINSVIFDNDLSPSQARQIQEMTSLNVVDRTELILDIFAKHAKTKMAKMQVELAQLEYNYSRLKNMWKHLSRIQGGIGFRGPGEKQIELDRREIKKRIKILKDRLDQRQISTSENRKKRNDMLNVALVGYTNAGKSTLFNQITKEDLYAADKLFATLDATTRKVFLPSGNSAVITDTIGFIKKLPHALVRSFYSTLLEVVEADLLLHVVDLTHSDLFSLIESVENVLKEIKAHNKNILMVFNKADLVKNLHTKFLFKQLQNMYPHALFISAKSKADIMQIIDKIEFFINKKEASTFLRIPKKMEKLISFIHDNAEVISYDFDHKSNEEILEINIDLSYIPNIEKQIKDFKLLEFINS